jgi:RNA polymerase sigma factor (sigma-70 family)
MATPSLGAVFQHLRKLVAALPASERPDEQLLQRFVTERDEAAFGILLQRHGPMVLQVCARVLGHVHDVEDAFQATFLVLARKATTIRKPRAVGSWLHGVAYRIANQVKAAGGQSAGGKCSEQASVQADPEAELTWREMRVVLDEELQRLPARYRDPLLLCYLEGRTQDEAARQLGWSKSTLRRRLEKARELLRIRLTRLGLSLSAALLGTLLTPTAVSSALPAELMGTTMQAVLPAAGAQATGLGGASLRVTALADGLIRALFVAKLQAVTLMVLAPGLIATGAGLWVRVVETAQPAPTQPKSGLQVMIRPPAGPVIRTDAYGDLLPDGVQVRLGSTRLSMGNSIHPSAFAFAPDGQKVAAGSDGGIRVWEAATGKTVLCLDAPSGRILSIAFAPGSKLLAAGSRDGTIRLWNLDAGVPLREFRGHEDKVFGLAFSPDGQLLASGSTAGTLRLWKVATGEEYRRLGVPAAESGHSVTWPIAFLADNRTVATRDLRYRIRLWDSASGKELRRLDWLPEPLSAIALAPDGTVVAAAEADRPTIRLWRLASGHELPALRGHRDGIEALAFSANAKALASAGVDGTIRWWEVGTGTEVAQARTDQAACQALAFSPDSRLLASAADTTIRLWNSRTGKELYPWEGHRGGVLTVAFSPDGKRVVSAGTRDSILQWDPTTGRQLKVWNTAQRQMETAAACSSDGHLLATGDIDGVIRLFNGDTGQELCRWQAHKTWVSRLAFSADGQRLASSGQDRIPVLWEPRTGREVTRFTEDQDGTDAAALSPDGRILAYGRQDGTILVRETATGKIVQRFRSALRSARLAFSPDGRTLASATTARAEPEPGVVYLWELATGQARWQTSASDGRAYSLTFSPEGRMLALGSGDHLIHRWDLAAGRELTPFAGHFGAVTSLAFAPDGKLLASGSMDATVLIWREPLQPSARRGTAHLPRDDLEVLWNALAGADAEKAYRAIWTLAAAAEQAVSLLKTRLQTAATNAGQHQNEKRPLEQPTTVLSPPQLRELRAVEVLELARTAEARRFLAVLAQGAAAAQTADAARAALRRMDRPFGAAR